MSRIMERNGVLKIVSVVIAIILWLYAVSELNPEVTRPLSDIEIQIENAEILENRGLTLVKDPAARTSIRIRGLGNDVSRVNVDNIKAIIDLSKIEKEGTQQIALRIDGLTPREVRLDSIPEVSIEINKIIRKSILVDVDLYGQKPIDYYVHNPSLDPHSVTIVGAESLVNQVVKGGVQINLNDAKDTLNLSLPITLYGEDNNAIGSRYVSLLQEYVIVTVPIHPLRNDIPITPILIGNPAEGYVVESIEASPRSLSINGYPEFINNLSELATEVIDISGTDKDINLSVGLEEVQGIHIDNRDPQEVQVNIRVNIVEETIQKSFEINDIELLNVPEDYTVEVLEESIVLIAEGRYNTINSLTSDSFTAALNLQNLTEGEHELTPQIVTPGNVKKEGTDPETISVILTPLPTTSPSPDETEEPNGDEPPIDNTP